MQVRFSIARGQPVALDDSGEILGGLTSIVLDPDRGTVVGFFVDVITGFLMKKKFFLSAQDIQRWGRAVFVRRAEVLGDPADFIRLESLLTSPRTMLGQKIFTKSGAFVGTCKDVQFDTQHFRLHWIFPKKWMRWGLPIASTEVLEVTDSAIIIRDPLTPLPVEESPTELLLPRTVEPA